MVFTAWLETLQAFFAAYDKQLDELLTYSADADPVKWEGALRETVKLPPPTGYDWPPPRDLSAYPPQIRAVFERDRLDPNVYSMPSPLFVVEDTGDIQWFYIIDLDHQRFHVLSSNNHVVCFSLDQVPHGRQFVRHMRELAYLEPDEDADDSPDEATHGRPGPKAVPSSALGGARGDGGGDSDGGDRSLASEIAADKGRHLDDGGEAKASGRRQTDSHEVFIRIANEESASLQLHHSPTVVQADESQRDANANLVMRKLLFIELVEKYKSFLCNHVAGYSRDDFGYREFAFAILSLAAGEFSLLNADEVVLRRHRGSVVIGLTLADTEVNLLSAYKPRGADGELHVGAGDNCIPCFGHGAHKPGVAAGSAPTGVSTFWLGNVAIHLCGAPAASAADNAGEHAMQDRLDNASAATALLKSAIAETVRFVMQGSVSRRASDCYGIIFSLARVVLVRIQAAVSTPTARRDEGSHLGTARGGTTPTAVVAVEHSGWLPLLALRPLPMYSRHTRRLHVAATFAAMARLFDDAAAAGAAAQASAAANAGVLPDEVLEQIMEHADWRTRHTMARASARCARYAATRVRFNMPGKVRSLAHLRPVTIAQGTYSVKGYAISHHGGGGGGVCGNGAGGGKDINCKQDPGSVRSSGSEEAEDDEEEEDGAEADKSEKRGGGKAWYVGTKSIMPWWYRPATTRFFPVIGEGDRQSLLVETPCVLARFELHLLLDRKDDFDGGVDG